jgi:hypothetical protein
VLGVGDVELEHVDGGRQLAGGAPGQRQPSAGTGQDDVGALFERQLGHPVRQRIIGEDTGDEEVLAVENAHVAEPSRHPRLLA